MNFSDKIRYDRIFYKVTHKGGESEINYIKIFQNAQTLSVLVGSSYSENQLMHIFLDNFSQSGKYIAQIANHQEELRREEDFTDQNSLSITSLHTDYSYIGSSSGSGGNTERENRVQTKYTFYGDTNHSAYFLNIRKDKGESHTAGDLGRQLTERTPRKNFQNHLKITKKDERLPVAMKGLIMNCKENPRTVMMITIKDICIYGTNVW